MLPKHHDMDGFMAITLLSPQRESLAWNLLRPPPANADIKAGAFHVAGSSKNDAPRSDHAFNSDTVSNEAFAGAENRFAALTFRLG